MYKLLSLIATVALFAQGVLAANFWYPVPNLDAGGQAFYFTPIMDTNGNYFIPETPPSEPSETLPLLEYWPMSDTNSIQAGHETGINGLDWTNATGGATYPTPVFDGINGCIELDGSDDFIATGSGAGMGQSPSALFMHGYTGLTYVAAITWLSDNKTGWIQQREDGTAKRNYLEDQASNIHMGSFTTGSEGFKVMMGIKTNEPLVYAWNWPTEGNVYRAQWYTNSVYRNEWDATGWKPDDTNKVNLIFGPNQNGTKYVNLRVHGLAIYAGELTTNQFVTASTNMMWKELGI